MQDWIERGVAGTDHYVTQFLTGHRSFGTYLKRIGKIQDDRCRYCGEVDAPEHLLDCTRWERERNELGILLQEDLTVDDFSRFIKEGRWADLKGTISKIVRQKVREEG